ncbi:hypothetical protein E3N88_04336 [Mikania micrantha]|uniref:Uncharacterized protein n=1 Tax=Mikania micrantha TaxID=192012 RepID=A0A5N6PWB4_9ASTR|nr:hypothetical protein E3N88_04336 [Mikania micrantha]
MPQQPPPTIHPSPFSFTPFSLYSLSKVPTFSLQELTQIFTISCVLGVKITTITCRIRKYNGSRHFSNSFEASHLIEETMAALRSSTWPNSHHQFTEWDCSHIRRMALCQPKPIRRMALSRTQPSFAEPTSRIVPYSPPFDQKVIRQSLHSINRLFIRPYLFSQGSFVLLSFDRDPFDGSLSCNPSPSPRSWFGLSPKRSRLFFGHFATVGHTFGLVCMHGCAWKGRTLRLHDMHPIGYWLRTKHRINKKSWMQKTIGSGCNGQNIKVPLRCRRPLGQAVTGKSLKSRSVQVYSLMSPRRQPSPPLPSQETDPAVEALATLITEQLVAILPGIITQIRNSEEFAKIFPLLSTEQKKSETGESSKKRKRCHSEKIRDLVIYTEAIPLRQIAVTPEDDSPNEDQFVIVTKDDILIRLNGKTEREPHLRDDLELLKE